MYQTVLTTKKNRHQIKQHANAIHQKHIATAYQHTVSVPVPKLAHLTPEQEVSFPCLRGCDNNFSFEQLFIFIFLKGDYNV